uniref:Uncharacterized protein n=1 Tax=Arundo donax TaxID=35708 RepID=A0A0A9C6Y7_ARUDO
MIKTLMALSTFLFVGELMP